MRGNAHAIISGAAGAVLATLTYQPLLPSVLFGAVGGLLPDIDHPHSTLGRYVPWPAAAVENHRTGFVANGRRWFGGHTVWHRGETHSVGAVGIATMGAMGTTVGALDWARHTSALVAALARGGLHLPGPWEAGAVVGAAVLVGYLSHLVADLVNVSPQMLWWPFSRRMVHVPHWHGISERSEAGHWAEAGAVVLALIGAVAVVVR